MGVSQTQADLTGSGDGLRFRARRARSCSCARECLSQSDFGSIECRDATPRTFAFEIPSAECPKRGFNGPEKLFEGKWLLKNFSSSELLGNRQRSFCLK